MDIWNYIKGVNTSEPHIITKLNFCTQGINIENDTLQKVFILTNKDTQYNRVWIQQSDKGLFQIDHNGMHDLYSLRYWQDKIIYDIQDKIIYDIQKQNSRKPNNRNITFSYKQHLVGSIITLLTDDNKTTKEQKIQLNIPCSCTECNLINGYQYNNQLVLQTSILPSYNLECWQVAYAKMEHRIITRGFDTKGITYFQDDCSYIVHESVQGKMDFIDFLCTFPIRDMAWTTEGVTIPLNFQHVNTTKKYFSGQCKRVGPGNPPATLRDSWPIIEACIQNNHLVIKTFHLFVDNNWWDQVQIRGTIATFK